MSENVKIDIQERDLTSGAGIANTSRDVAFVLGLALILTALIAATAKSNNNTPNITARTMPTYFI